MVVCLPLAVIKELLVSPIYGALAIIIFSSILIAIFTKSSYISRLIDLMLCYSLVFCLRMWFSTFESYIHGLYDSTGKDSIILIPIIIALFLYAASYYLLKFKESKIKLPLIHKTASNYKILFFVAFTISLTIIFISSFNDSKDISGLYLYILGLTGLYALANVFLIIYLIENSKNKDMVAVLKQYKDLLEDLTFKLKSREHEYKNQLNVILSIAENDNLDKNRRINDYILKLKDSPREQIPTAIIKDNAMISFLMLRYQQIASEQKINFTVFADTPFPKYKMGEVDFLEMISNLINNAFEAVKSLDENKRLVLIEFKDDKINVHNKLNANSNLENLSKVMTSQNSYSFNLSKKSSPTLPNNGSLSSKGGGRGYEMTNIISLVKKYGGKIEMNIEDENLQILIRLK